MSIRILAVAAVVALSASTGVASASAALPGVSIAGKTFANCTALNAVYKHGVGKSGAKDKVSGSSKPVTNFKVSTTVYKQNTKSDRDKDGIACEKR